MKFLCLTGFVGCMLLTLNSNCQQTPPLNQRQIEKPFLFNQLPARITCPSAALGNIFSASVSSNIIVAISADMKLEGTVLAKVAISPEQLSINIRCTNFQDALLNISRITQADGSFSYIGRIVSPRHGDVLLLWKENGQYSFIRQKQLLTMVE